MKRQVKTIRAYSDKLNQDTFNTLDGLFDRYGAYCETLFKQYSGIRHMTDVSHWYTPRNTIRKQERAIREAKKQVAVWQDTIKDKKTKGKKTHRIKPDAIVIRLSRQKTINEQYAFQGRHMTQAVKQVCMSLSSMWTNLGDKLKRIVSENEALSDNERTYLNYVFSAKPIWQMILMRHEKDITGKSQYPTIRNALTPKELKHCTSYIRRLTRKHKPSPHGLSHRVMLYDEMMYRFETDGQDTYFVMMSGKRGELIRLKLTGPFCYSQKGDLRLVLDRNKKRLEIHKMISVKTKTVVPKTEALGVDKGLATLLSCNNGNEYGEAFSTHIYQEAERINKRNSHRNVYISAAKDIKAELKVLTSKKVETARAKHRINSRIGSLKRKLNHLNEHHIGNKLYDRQHKKRKTNITRLVNMAVRKMLTTEKPAVLVKEDLTFTKDKLPKAATRYEAQSRRKLASWSKGLLNDRLTYLCENQNIATIDVNPAYTSQFCPHCGAPFDKRIGIHHEIAVCPHCGNMNANVAAAINILKRKDDPDITLYTPYKQVKTILMTRYNQA